MNDKGKNILSILKEKSKTKQIVYDNTLQVFNILKEILQEIVGDMNDELRDKDDRISLNFRDKGTFEAEIKVAGDILVFNMHSNVFEFENSHNIWKTTYVRNDSMNSYCGVVNIYNFLSDSFKYNRLNDIGYLIGRLFINKDNFYFVEGKRQMGFLYNEFGSKKIDRAQLKDIVQSAILYSLEFDLLVPPYERVSEISIGQIVDRINHSKMKTGKRLGFQFSSNEDVIS